MITKKGDGPRLRGTATTQTNPHQEADHGNCNITPRSELPDLGEQFEISYDDETLTTSERFERFHRDNPHVYTLLTSLSRDWVFTTGRKKLGIRALYERLRWELAVSTDSDDDYRLNDHYPPYYARLIDHQEPDLAGLFELRRSPEADAWIKRVAS